MTNKKKKKQKQKQKKSVQQPQGKMFMGTLPPGMTMKLAANFGTEELFVARVWIQGKDILKYLDIPNDDEADFRFDRIVEQLDIARVHLSRIEDANFGEMPTFDQQAEYVAFYNSIWWAYKDRFQLFMRELGYDIGFIFQNEKNFNEGAERFLAAYPDAVEFVDVAKTDRESWQNVLATHRNNLHSGDRRKEEHDMNNPKDARMVFDNVWQAIEENYAYLGGLVMKDGWTLVEIPEDKRDKDVAIRFQPYLKGLLDGSIKLPLLVEPDSPDQESQ